MQSFADYKIYNNFVFLIPIIVGFYIQVSLFTMLAIIVCCTSFYYHLMRLHAPHHFSKARKIDMTAALACYLYLSYFILYHKEVELHLPLFLGLIATLLIFSLGKYKKSETIHAGFHASIAVMAGIIGLI